MPRSVLAAFDSISKKPELIESPRLETCFATGTLKVRRQVTTEAVDPELSDAMKARMGVCSRGLIRL
jgi:hypothetical protein